MAWEQVATGSLFDAVNIEQYEGFIGEGNRAQLQLDLRYDVGSTIANQLRSQLIARGIPGVEVTRGSPRLNITWRKGFPWLAVVVAIILALAILAIIILAWRLFREIVPEGLQPIVGTMLLVGGAALAAVVAYKVVKR